MKLNLFLARCGISSRRKASDLIKNGRVQVNGKVVTEPYHRVNDEDKVAVDGKAVSPKKFVYVMLNKPRGYTCTLKDRFAKLKVTDLLPESLGRVFPVGRLDKESCGLLILTNDGDFAQRLTHPRYQVEKEYEVSVRPQFNPKDTGVLKKGIIDAGERLSLCGLKVLRTGPEGSKISVVLKEGRKREIRRIFFALGYRVSSLKRTRIGNVTLESLPSGKYRYLSETEISRLSDKTFYPDREEELLCYTRKTLMRQESA